jgi:hypothetical protein
MGWYRKYDTVCTLNLFIKRNQKSPACFVTSNCHDQGILSADITKPSTGRATWWWYLDKLTHGWDFLNVWFAYMCNEQIHYSDSILVYSAVPICFHVCSSSSGSFFVACWVKFKNSCSFRWLLLKRFYIQCL